MKRLGFIALGWLWVGLVLTAALGGRLVDYYQNPFNVRDQTRIIDIPAGTSLKNISRLLADKGVINQPLVFRLTARLAGLGRRVRAGEYCLSAALSPREVLAALTSGPPLLHRLTVPEGLTLEEIARLVEAAGLGQAEAFVRAAGDPALLLDLKIPGLTAEGYLFPETYYLPKGLAPRAVIRLMVKRFRQVMDQLHREVGRKTHLKPHQTVILASLVEAETKAAEERPLVAGVFMNRLRKKMLLQCDPTVIYGLDDFNGRLRKNHLAVTHPYNTYIYPGLPPGPIGNPGEAALRAALDPAKTDYLYFVSRNDGTHEFSQTYAQHQKAVAQYRSRR